MPQQVGPAGGAQRRRRRVARRVRRVHRRRRRRPTGGFDRASTSAAVRSAWPGRSADRQLRPVRPARGLGAHPVEPLGGPAGEEGGRRPDARRLRADVAPVPHRQQLPADRACSAVSAGSTSDFKRAEDDEFALRLDGRRLRVPLQPGGASPGTTPTAALEAWLSIPRVVRLLRRADRPSAPRTHGYLDAKKRRAGTSPAARCASSAGCSSGPRRTAVGGRRLDLGGHGAVRPGCVDAADGALSVAYDLSYVESMRGPGARRRAGRRTAMLIDGRYLPDGMTLRARRRRRRRRPGRAHPRRRAGRRRHPRHRARGRRPVATAAADDDALHGREDRGAVPAVRSRQRASAVRRATGRPRPGCASASSTRRLRPARGRVRSLAVRAARSWIPTTAGARLAACRLDASTPTGACRPATGHAADLARRAGAGDVPVRRPRLLRAPLRRARCVGARSTSCCTRPCTTIELDRRPAATCRRLAVRCPDGNRFGHGRRCSCWPPAGSTTPACC